MVSGRFRIFMTVGLKARSFLEGKMERDPKRSIPEPSAPAERPAGMPPITRPVPLREKMAMQMRFQMQTNGQSRHNSEKSRKTPRQRKDAIRLRQLIGVTADTIELTDLQSPEPDMSSLSYQPPKRIETKLPPPQYKDEADPDILDIFIEEQNRGMTWNARHQILDNAYTLRAPLAPPDVVEDDYSPESYP